MRDVQTTGKRTTNRRQCRSRLPPPESLPRSATWANPCVWTERMLTTLEQGVRGGRWHTLIDKVYAPLNLFAASGNVIGNRGAAGVDHQTVENFLAHRQEELDRLHEALRTDTLSSAGRAAGLDSETGKQGATTAGRSDRARPRGANRAAARVGTDLRRHIFAAQLRLPPRPGVSSRPGTGRAVAERRQRVRRRCGPQELLRHDPEARV